MMDEKTLLSAETLFQLAYSEDIAQGDITTDNFIPSGQIKTAQLLAKADGIIAGLPLVKMVFQHFDENMEWVKLIQDGDEVKKDDIIAEFRGKYRALLSGERIALNFLQRMSGIASYANKFVKQAEGTGVQILDTRKTLPAYRLLDKYSARMGGAKNHRMGLFDMVMLKDNHIQAAGGITQAVRDIKNKVSVSTKIEVETTNLEQVQEAVEAGADIIMLDNMSNERMQEAVNLINGKAKVEASGNMTLERIAEVAKTGIDYISVGALTHSVQALDISQRLID